MTVKNIMSYFQIFYLRHLRGTVTGRLIRAAYYLDIRAFARSTISSVLPETLSRLVGDAAFSIWTFWYRARYVGKYIWGRTGAASKWLVVSRETSNFTYDLTPRNKRHLAVLLAIVTGRSASELEEFIVEIDRDEKLRRTIADLARQLDVRAGVETKVQFGRRVGWYALVRAMKPRIVVETGVEKGLGAVVICAALMRNAEDGYPGKYVGTDIDRGAGLLWCAPYNSMGTILYGDSVESLSGFEGKIDIFINDSDHSASYEGLEYQTVASKLSDNAVIVGDNAHVTDELLHFSQSAGRHFLFFREEPAGHWYPGAGIGLSFVSSA